MGISDNFTRSVGNFKAKHEAIYELQQIKNADYLSLEELQEASGSLVKLDQELKQSSDYSWIAQDQDYLDACVEAQESIKEQKELLAKYEEIKGKNEAGLTEEEKDIKAKWDTKKERREEFEKFKQAYGIDKETIKTQQALDQASVDLDKLSETLSGHVSVKDMSQAASQMDRGYDQTLSDLSSIVTGDASTEYIEAWARVRFGDQLYEAASAIKKGASTAIDGVADYMGLGDTFGGSWRNPLDAAKKIQTGLKTIQSAAGKISQTASNVFSQVTGRKSVILNGLDLTKNTGMSNLVALSGAATTGIGSFYAFKDVNIASGISGVAAMANSMRQLKGKASEASQKDTGSSGSPSGDELENEEKGTDISKQEQANNSNDGDSGYNDDYSADIIYEISVVLDGMSSSKNSHCTINGVSYRLSGYVLSQELLQPMVLSFSIEKEEKVETQSDVIFADVTQLIGKSFEMSVSTAKSSQGDDKVNPRKAFVFKGMVIDVSASRATASAQSASVTVATWDALLQTAPHCRSFEDMTLKEIVDSVLKPYRDIKSDVSPRFKGKIPYVVQYDQSDYAFISMLAVRFGEWMYSTGDTFVFGELDVEDSSSAKLEYPGGSLMSYSLHQNMSLFSFCHLLPDHYRYGKEKSIRKAPAQGMVEGKVNDWTDKAYNASMQRFQDEWAVALKAGGFDSGKESEGADDILDYSLMIGAQGKTAAIMTVQGFSKLAMLKIGQVFLIRDNVQNKSGESKDLKQKSLKVIGINHSFDYRQEYSNSFMAIPVACNYPSYSDADVFATAPQQRAKVVDNKDEQKLGRVRVQFPWQEILSEDMKTPWLRIAVPYAGQNKGQQFVPEIGEEVMVGFEMNNAERPYVIGSFYNGGVGNPDEAWAVSQEKDGTSNNIKAIRTRNGHTILFNDKGEAGLIEIYDNKNNVYHITLSADDKKITIYSDGEIEVAAGTDINIAAKGNIGISADGDVGIKSKGNVSIDADKEISIQASKVKVR